MGVEVAVAAVPVPRVVRVTPRGFDRLAPECAGEVARCRMVVASQVQRHVHELKNEREADDSAHHRLPARSPRFRSSSHPDPGRDRPLRLQTVVESRSASQSHPASASGSGERLLQQVLLLGVVAAV